MRANKLSATASEFKPSWSACIPTVPTATVASQTCHQDHQKSPHPSNTPPVASTSAGQDQQQQQLQQHQQQQGEAEEWDEDEYEEYDDTWGYYDEEGNWIAYKVQANESQDSLGTAAAGTSDTSGTQQQQLQQQQQQQQEQPDISAEDAVALLHSCYPAHPRAILQQLLESCDHDVQQAARILSDMDFEQRRSRIAAAAAAASGGANGMSRRITGPTSAAAAGGAARKKQQFDYSLEQFPALGNEAKAPAAAGQQEGSKQQQTPAVGGWAAITKKPPVPSSTGSSIKLPAGGAAGGANAPRTQVPTHSSSSSSRMGAEAVPWVETGAAVSQEYAAARAEAADYAKVRNACFHQATIAFLAGDKALAKELSAKGKAAAEAMWSAHQQASSQLYSQRNARLQQQATGSGRAGSTANVIDLHGLHVQEMMQVLPQQLQALAAQQHDSASVIVGVGKHTKGPPAGRMLPAAEALLKELGYSYKQPQPGLLRVRLR